MYASEKPSLPSTPPEDDTHSRRLMDRPLLIGAAGFAALGLATTLWLRPWQAPASEQNIPDFPTTVQPAGGATVVPVEIAPNQPGIFGQPVDGQSDGNADKPLLTTNLPAPTEYSLPLKSTLGA